MKLDAKQEKAIEQIYKEMYIPLCSYAMSTFRNRQLAEDAVQDTFRIACTKAESFLASCNQRGWLVNTLKYVIRNTRRSQSRMNALMLSVDVIMTANVPVFYEDTDLTFRITYSKLLGEQDFELPEMVIIYKYTLLEAAQELNITVEACKKRVQRAKKKLRGLFEYND